MKIIDAEWTPEINMLLIKCNCGREFWWRADRINVRCSKCERVENNFNIKNRGRYIEGSIKYGKTN